MLRQARSFSTRALALGAVCLGGCGVAPGTPGSSDRAAEALAPPPASSPEAARATQGGNSTVVEQTPSQRVLVLVDGQTGEREERWLTPEAAEAAGHTLVDLSDDWTPYLFAEQRTDAGQLLPNRYRRVFIGLANDELDGDGAPLEPGTKNYLELYGIFPSLSVLRERFLRDEARSCVEPEGQAALLAVKSVRATPPADARRHKERQTQLGKELERARREARAPTLTALVEQVPSFAAKVNKLERWAADRNALAAAEQRLICEGFLPDPASDEAKRSRPRHEPLVQDEAFRNALRGFQQKHMIYDDHVLRPNTLSALSRTALENDHASLIRAFRERVVAAADVIEDGTANGQEGPPPTYRSSSGEELPIRNLVDEHTDAASRQLGIDTPEKALAFFKRHPAAELENLTVGVKLPPRPEYHASHMELSIVVDRGDVWYDPPFDDQDKWHTQERQRYPSLSLFLDYQGQKLLLARWRTTIGGWRAEQATNGYEYYRYKGSDTGPRVLRKVVSGPVWIAPESTPIRSLHTSKKIEGRWQGLVNYEELGPGYESAYGLVAGYFVIPGRGDDPDLDRGIRAHGSSDYLSIYRDRYSHGCHRLPNHVAIRLYDFVLEHRNMRVLGDSPVSFARQFLAKDEVFDMRIPSRGFEFELDPPMFVNVLEGTIRGLATQPIEGAIPKPGVRYPPPPPEESTAAGLTTASGDARDVVSSKGGP